MSIVIPEVTVDVQNETFKDKIELFLVKLGQDLEASRKEADFHKLIIDTFEEHGVEHDYTVNLKEAVSESEKFIKALEDRQIQGNKLGEFLNGEFVLEFDKFVFLMIDVLGSQMVNYVELKNEFLTVSKLWAPETIEDAVIVN